MKKKKKVKIKPFLNYAFPLVRRVFPELIATNTVSVQPMSSPTGLHYALRYLYSNDELFTEEDYGDDYDLFTEADYGD